MVPIAQNRSHSAAAVLELLCAQFPRCFFHDEARRQPLKVGIHNDVLLALGDAVTPSELARALQIYVNNRIYQSRLRPGATRIDLNGEPAGTVTAGEAAFARAKERARKEQRPTPSSPPRSSLAELRPGSGAGRRQIHEKARQPPHPAHHAD
jgi:ProP effector